MTQSAAVRSMHRPEGTASTPTYATALVSVALAALAVGLGVGMRNWRIGAFFGGCSVLVGGLGCSSARQTLRGGAAGRVPPAEAVPALQTSARTEVAAPVTAPAPLRINSTLITVVQGSIAEQRQVDAICFSADPSRRVAQGQSLEIFQAAGREPFRELAAPEVPLDQTACSSTRAGALASHGVKRLIHMVGPRAGNDGRLKEVYEWALQYAEESEAPRVALALAIRQGGHALAENAQLAMAAIRDHLTGEHMLTEIRIVVENADHMRAVAAAIEAQRGAA
jgi:O-acetyl-ADP-ribose deacetylase (regulator of RNase III)